MDECEAWLRGLGAAEVEATAGADAGVGDAGVGGAGDGGAGDGGAGVADAEGGDAGDCGTAALAPLSASAATEPLLPGCGATGASAAAGALRAGSIEEAVAPAPAGAGLSTPLPDARRAACWTRSAGSSVSNDARARIASAPRMTAPKAASSIHHRLLRVGGVGGVGGLGPRRTSSLPPSRCAPTSKPSSSESSGGFATKCGLFPCQRLPREKPDVK